MVDALYYGDNLQVLRDSIASDSVDLVYLDPPFNSQASYNVLFKGPSGKMADAQIEAFEDTWHWGEGAERAFSEVLASRYTQAAALLHAMRSFLGENDVMAYLAMMAVRLIELHRVLKPIGSLYLHCDPTAGHYLKLSLDSIFDVRNYRSQIIWKRSAAHSDGKQGRRIHGHLHDMILFYTKSEDWTWNMLYTEYEESYTKNHYSLIDPASKRRFRADNLTAARPGGDTNYEWRVKRPDRDGSAQWQADLTEEYKTPMPGWVYEGIRPYRGRYWAYSKKNMEEFERIGLIYYTSSGFPNYKRFFDETPGVPLQDLWTDIPPINSQAQERLGYPTQKPVALLERIIAASSNPGDLVLDPFCGCGTTIHAAQKLGRQWIGIDVTHLAISLIERRLKDAFPGIAFEVHGTPKDLESALDLARRDKYQFQWWAVSLVEARPYGGRKKGPDTGIDGILFFRSDKNTTEKALVSVKGGEHVGVGMVRELISVVEREKAAIGVLITLALPTRAMEREAIAAGLCQTPFESVPKIQIITLAELFQGIRPRIPRIDVGATFRTAAREKADVQGRLL